MVSLMTLGRLIICGEESRLPTVRWKGAEKSDHVARDAVEAGAWRAVLHEFRWRDFVLARFGKIYCHFG